VRRNPPRASRRPPVSLRVTIDNDGEFYEEVREVINLDSTLANTEAEEDSSSSSALELDCEEVEDMIDDEDASDLDGFVVNDADCEVGDGEYVPDDDEDSESDEYTSEEPTDEEDEEMEEEEEDEYDTEEEEDEDDEESEDDEEARITFTITNPPEST